MEEIKLLYVFSASMHGPDESEEIVKEINPVLTPSVSVVPQRHRVTTFQPSCLGARVRQAFIVYCLWVILFAV